MHAYARNLKTLFTRNANPKLARPMKRYMRDQFDYLGIKSPELAELLAQHYQRHGLPPLAALDPIVRDLWALPQREFQYAATSMISKQECQLPSGFIRTLEFLMVNKSWWDTVDSISTGAIGVHFKRYPKVKEKYLAKWSGEGASSDHRPPRRRSPTRSMRGGAMQARGTRRATILFQLSYKEETDFSLLCDIIRENLRASGHLPRVQARGQAHIAHPDPTRDRGSSTEFFINKAIGWALRQYSRIDPQGVRKFVAETPLQPLSSREALKWLARRQR